MYSTGAGCCKRPWQRIAKSLCGCYSVRFSCSPASTVWIHTTKLVLHWQIYDEGIAKIGLISRPPWFSYGYRKCMFVDFLAKYISPPNWVHYWSVEVVHWTYIFKLAYILKMSSNLFYTCVFMMFVLWSSLNHTPIKDGCPIKKSNQITLANLSW